MIKLKSQIEIIVSNKMYLNANSVHEILYQKDGKNFVSKKIMKIWLQKLLKIISLNY